MFRRGKGAAVASSADVDESKAGVKPVRAAREDDFVEPWAQFEPYMPWVVLLLSFVTRYYRIKEPEGQSPRTIGEPGARKLVSRSRSSQASCSTSTTLGGSRISTRLARSCSTSTRRWASSCCTS